MARMTDAEIERLASRLAMLVSDGGESDNAGRAVGALARRLGLTGGQLKAIFLAGAESAGGHGAQLAEQSAHLAQLQDELDGARDTLRRTEAAARSLQRERDGLRLENDRLQETLDHRRSGRIVRVAMALVAVLAIGGAGWLSLYGPKLHLLGADHEAAGVPFYRSAVVRDAATPLHRDPDSTSPVVTTLAGGTHLAVRRVLWHNLMQWVEVQSGAETGYVVSTDLELS